MSVLDSIFTGATGIKSHQTRMNVISNNVANINTTGYKAGRVNFADLISQTLSEGQAESGEIAATNPIQSGLGVRVGSIDTVLAQGSLQNTGIDTDLAVEGDGLFIVNDGLRDLYTRDGTFAFDASGRLVDPGTGLVVQGKLADDNGVLQNEKTNLVIPPDRRSKARATTHISLSGNLDSSGSGQGEAVWSASTAFGTPAVLNAPTPVLNLGGAQGLAGLDSAGMKITLGKGNEIVESTIEVPVKNFANIDEMVAGLNALIDTNGVLKGEVFFEVDTTTSPNSLALRSVEGGAQVGLTVDNTDPAQNIVGALSLPPAGAPPPGSPPGTPPPPTALGGSPTISTTAPSTELNALANVGSDLTTGDIIRFTGVKPSGERFDGRFVFGDPAASPNSDGTSLKDLFDVVSDSFGGLGNIGIDNTGRMVLTDLNGNQVKGFDLNFSLLDPDGNSGIFGGDPPFSFSSNTQVFDEQGMAHSMTLNFTKSVVANVWNWSATVDGKTPTAGHVGKVVFNQSGALESLRDVEDNPPVLVFEPGNGKSALNIEIIAERDQLVDKGQEGLGGLTQFSAPSSASVREQDGRTSGSLVSTNIESDGTIRGLFSNGASQVLGKVMLASFSNPAGLRREGDNLFAETEASGQAVEGGAEAEIQGSIRAGSIELSNVDLAEEFTNMIITQRGFQASARSITTSDELLTELVNLKR